MTLYLDLEKLSKKIWNFHIQNSKSEKNVDELYMTTLRYHNKKLTLQAIFSVVTIFTPKDHIGYRISTSGN